MAKRPGPNTLWFVDRLGNYYFAAYKFSPDCYLLKSVATPSQGFWSDSSPGDFTQIPADDPGLQTFLAIEALAQG